MNKPDQEYEKIIKKPYTINVNTKNYIWFWNSYKDHSWEPETFRIFDRFIDPNYIYLDIGAWIGPTVLYGAQKAKRIFAIEPDIKAYNELKANIELNPEIKDKIVCKNIAITSKTGSFKLYSEGFSANSASSIMSTRQSEDYYTVQGVTFRELIKDFPLEEVNFIKIDIEGAEYSLIPQMAGIIKNLDKHPTIYLSLHPQFLFNHPPQNKILREFYRLNKRFKLKNLTDKIINALSFYKYFYDINGNLIENRKSLNSINDFTSIIISDEVF